MSLDITPSIPTGRKIIQSYGDCRFMISNVIYETPVLVFPTLILPWAIRSIDDFSVSSLSVFSQADQPTEILLVGCGLNMAIIQPAIRTQLKNNGIVVEPMDTGAACRTFNVLVAEDRRVAAALIPVD